MELDRVRVRAAQRIRSGAKLALGVSTPWCELPVRNYAASPDPHVMSRSARISIHIPSSLRACVGGARELDSSAGNVRDVLVELERRQPELHRCICDETGALRRHIGVFVNTSHVRDLNGLDTTLAPGDVVSIMTAVSGG